MEQGLACVKFIAVKEKKWLGGFSHVCNLGAYKLIPVMWEMYWEPLRTNCSGGV